MNANATWRKLHLRYGTANANRLKRMIANERTWHPANARLVQGHTFKKAAYRYTNALNVVKNSGTRNRSFRNAVLAAVKTPGVRIGKESAFGEVFDIGHGLVKKVVYFPNRLFNYLKIFMNEVRVGRTPGIEAVGPKVYAWRVVRNERGEMTQGEYIMDNFAAVPPAYMVMVLDDYIQKLGACPAPSHPIYAKLKAALLTFWRLTKGYHGDLHAGNIAVVVNRATKMPKSVVIFDYGAHKRFKSHTNTETCFDEYIDIIDREFQRRSRKQTVRLKNGVIPYFLGRFGQGRKANTNSLRGINVAGFHVSNQSKSIMAHMHPRNALRPKNKSQIKHNRTFFRGSVNKSRMTRSVNGQQVRYKKSTMSV